MQIEIQINGDPEWYLVSLMGGDATGPGNVLYVVWDDGFDQWLVVEDANVTAIRKVETQSKG